MGTAIVGVIGVIAGALATSGTQLWIAARQRRNDALAASRLTWAALANASAVVSSSREYGVWVLAAEATMGQAIVVWENNRMAMARSLDAFQYSILELAFIRLGDTVVQAGAFDADGLAAVCGDARLAEDLYYFDKGAAICHRAGRTRWQRLRYPSLRKRFDAELERALEEASPPATPLLLAIPNPDGDDEMSVTSPDSGGE